MKFRVRRASRIYEQDEPPCDGAYRCITGKLDGITGADWLVDLPDLDSLVCFMRANGGSIVVQVPWRKHADPNIPYLEIYDACRE